MIKFLFNGLMRDKNRSLFPVIVVALGVWLTVFFQAYLTGVLGDWIDLSARFDTGHVKIMTQAFAENASQNPNDLAMIGTEELLEELREDYPDLTWIERIKFGGLFDIPDEYGETKSQSTIIGFGVDLLSQGTTEIETMNIKKSLVQGRLPQDPGEVLISNELAEKLDVDLGENGTLLSSTMYGAMSFYNFDIVGTVAFGTSALDRGAIIADIQDVQSALDMDNAAGEILGIFKDNTYNMERAEIIKQQFNAVHTDSDDKFSPEMLQLKDIGFLGDYVKLIDGLSTMLVTVFVVMMSIILWNVGLLGGIRRYGEVGLRLAIGERKGHIYRSMIYESIMIGIIGSIIGTALGLGSSYWLQATGFNVGDMMKNATMMLPGVFRAKVTTQTYYIGFFPGVISMVLGTMLSGIGIYKRQTAQLFKELEV